MPIWPFKKTAPPPPPTCSIDFALSDDHRSIAQLLKRTIAFESQHSETDSVLDLTRVDYLGPFAAAILLANELHRRNGARSQQKIRFPVDKPKVKAFLHHSALGHLLGNGPLPLAGQAENVVPLRVVQKATWNAADPVIELVHRHAVISDDDETYLRNCVNEVIQNVEDHAKSQFGAVYCARYLAGPKKIRVAIVDRGLGIGTTLSAHHAEIQSAETALVKVVKGGISAQSRPNNMGVGISNLWGHITNPLGGEIFIVTEDVLGYSDRAGKLRTMPLGARFAGTGVFFTVPVGR